jgi:hypothetical protein
MNRLRSVAALLVLSIALVAASGGWAGAATAPPDRSSGAATGGRASAKDPVEAGGGLVTFEVPRGWKVGNRASRVPPNAYLRLEDSWSIDEEEPVHKLATVTRGAITVALGAEPLYELVDEPTWRGAFMDLLGRQGATFAIQAPATWAGNPSNQAIGELDGSYLRVDFVEIDSQLLVALTLADATPTQGEQRDIAAFLDSVEVDDSVLGPLQNGIDARIHADASETGAGNITVSTLMPTNWVHDTTAEVGQLYVDPEAENAFVGFTLARDEAGLEGEIERELDDFAAQDFFGKKTKRQRITRDGISLVVVWDGNPKTTNAAAVYGTDGVVFFATYLVTDDDNELLQAMVDELVLVEHNEE